jgi:hypothetical protein
LHKVFAPIDGPNLPNNGAVKKTAKFAMPNTRPYCEDEALKKLEVFKRVNNQTFFGKTWCKAHFNLACSALNTFSYTGPS